MTDSTQVPWDLKRLEYYHLMGAITFDVLAAKKILKRRAHPVLMSPRADLKSWVARTDFEQITPEQEEAKYGRQTLPFLSGFQGEEHLARANMSIPLIFAKMREGGWLIDGHGRLTKGMRDGLQEFPAVQLTYKESAQVSQQKSDPRVWQNLFGGA